MTELRVTIASVISKIWRIYADELINYFETEDVSQEVDFDDADEFDEFVDNVIEELANSEKYQHLWENMDWTDLSGLEMGHILRYVVENQRDRFDNVTDTEVYTNQSKLKCLFNYLYITENKDLFKPMLKYEYSVFIGIDPDEAVEILAEEENDNIC